MHASLRGLMYSKFSSSDKTVGKDARVYPDFNAQMHLNSENVLSKFASTANVCQLRKTACQSMKTDAITFGENTPGSTVANV